MKQCRRLVLHSILLNPKRRNRSYNIEQQQGEFLKVAVFAASLDFLARGETRQAGGSDLNNFSIGHVTIDDAFNKTYVYPILDRHRLLLYAPMDEKSRDFHRNQIETV